MRGAGRMMRGGGCVAPPPLDPPLDLDTIGPLAPLPGLFGLYPESAEGHVDGVCVLSNGVAFANRGVSEDRYPGGTRTVQ